MGVADLESWKILIEGKPDLVVLTADNNIGISNDQCIKLDNLLSVFPCDCPASLRDAEQSDALFFVAKEPNSKCCHCNLAQNCSKPIYALNKSPVNSTSARLYYSASCGASLGFKTIRLTFEDNLSRDRFIWTLTKRLQEIAAKRPKKLLVFINPFGGRKRAKSIYFRKVDPIFRLCGIQCDIVTTSHAGHSREYILENDLSRFDGAVCVGGDGMANELINALMQKALRTNDTSSNAVKPCLPVGVIPAGSTDALVCTTTGSHCATNSALLIAMGSRICVDLGSIHSNDKLVRYFAGFLSYGFFGDNIQTAEKYRWMGPLRYTWTGWQTFLKNQTYSGVVNVQVLADDDDDKSICLKDCQKCSESPKRSIESQAKKQITFEAKLQSLSCCLIANRCSKSKGGIAPLAHLGDGLMDILVVEQCSRIDFFRFLAAITNSSRQYPFKFDFVKSYKASSFKFTPQPSKKQTSVWNCDGEVLQDCSEIIVKCHNQALTLFASGVQSTEVDVSSSTSLHTDLAFMSKTREHLSDAQLKILCAP